MYPETGLPYFNTLTPVIVKLWVLCAELRKHAKLLRTTNEKISWIYTGVFDTMLIFSHDVNFLPYQCKSVTFRGRGQNIDSVVKLVHRLK